MRSNSYSSGLQKSQRNEFILVSRYLTMWKAIIIVHFPQNIALDQEKI